MKHGSLRRLGALLLTFALSLSLVVTAWAAAADVPTVSVTSDAANDTAGAGTAVTLTAEVTGGGSADPGSVSWTCANPNTPNATVTADSSNPLTATLTAQGTGEVTVTFSATVGSQSVTGTCTVTFIPSLTLTPDTLSLTTGATGRITATVVPAGQEVTWNSSDASVATVEDGVVTAVSTGTATITAAAAYGSAANETVTATCSVTVSGDSVGSVSITTYNSTNNPLILAPGGTGRVRATVSPLTADQTVTWSCSDTGVAEINRDTGVVLARGVGRAVLTATAGDKTATCAVEVSGVRLVRPASASVSLLVGENLTPQVESFGDAKLGRIASSWRSNDPLVAAVESSTGRITGRGPGDRKSVV